MVAGAQLAALAINRAELRKSGDRNKWTRERERERHTYTYIMYTHTYIHIYI